MRETEGEKEETFKTQRDLECKCSEVIRLTGESTGEDLRGLGVRLTFLRTPKEKKADVLVCQGCHDKMPD